MVDQIDQLILNTLNYNSRISFADIGRKINLSPSAVRERIQKLEDHDIIKNYTTEIDYSKVGYGIEAFIMLKLHTGKLKHFLTESTHFSEIKKAYRITGSQNIHMKVVLKNQLHLQEFIDQLIDYGDTTTHLILSEIKSN
ncbi:ArsR family transcriptional regulator [Tenacibaculum sp. SZ-18]|uniref:Lrp/AsnC family transcriptional regulator n=1 Tax=Tenacibaculum sp. SZ-18 TaxID=754423 RepID=UPI000C2CE4A7|nr:Lrp/AsnC family transcriptional regulator [Tenacibaculum sp. SZ-18]AUC16853.1 ArsR family transcriptional regulator [Tenacibaculum sp. SZ-18]